LHSPIADRSKPAADQNLRALHRQKWKAWFPAILWLGVIAAESTSTFSAANTSSWLYPVFHFLTGVDPVRFAVWNGVLRKLGHFVGYFTLSVLLFRAWRATLTVPGLASWSARWAGMAWAISALVASLDEWHQTFLPSRTGTIHDVILDSAAALVAQLVIWGLLRERAAPLRS
jgi:VanZ family protein